jgi:hypothetical protein
MAPDVTTSTNLSGFLNQRGQFAVEESGDKAKESGVMSVNQWVRAHRESDPQCSRS